MGDSGGNIFTGSRLTYLLLLSFLLLAFNVSEYMFSMSDDTVTGETFLSSDNPLSGIVNTIMGIFTINIPDAPYPVYVILSMINASIIIIVSVITASYIYDGVQALGELIPF